jgi:hypothetical protein
MKFISILAGAWLLTASVVLGQEHGEHQHGPAAPAATGQTYAPGLGEIMALQQMRHSKLWFAGEARNWPLAAYEIDELKEGFEDVAKLFPTHGDVPLTPMVASITRREIPELASAVKKRDRTAFVRAFDALTAACNACHQSAKHGFISIRRPADLPYTNQSFAPTRP